MRAALFVAFVASAFVSAAPAPVAAQETQSQFLARCRAAILDSTPSAESWADGACAEQWPMVTRANPMVDALLSLFVAGTPSALDPADVRARAAMISWRSGGDGRLGDLTAEVVRSPTVRLSLRWGATGEPVPYHVVEALRVRGADVAPIGCYAYGAGESNSVWRVAAPGHVPFALTVYRREAPTASALSHLTVSVDAERTMPTLGDLRAAEPDQDWMETCG